MRKRIITGMMCITCAMNSTAFIEFPSNEGITQSHHQSVLVCSTQDSTPPLKVYQNYDFIPGETIIFEDNFQEDMDGEFPMLWNLEGGQGVVNKVGDITSLSVTEFYSIFTPRMLKKAYLPTKYTIECDTWLDEGYDSNTGLYIEFRDAEGNSLGTLTTSRSAYTMYFGNSKLDGKLDPSIANENYLGKWHHLAIAVNDQQIKIYCDQFRVLTVPNSGFTASAVAFRGDASSNLPMYFSNVRLASGGSMNMQGKKFTDSKLVTHGILFDYNQSTIKAESMGTINAVVQIMKDNPDIKFEIGGFTDNVGDDAYNLKLSSERAEAVMAQLIALGIDKSRLKAKGYGETNPIADNNTPDGRANNRRVEFTKH